MSRPLWIFALMLAGTPGVWADTKEKIPVERTTNDRQIIDTLAEIHDQGAALYSAGDTAGCYRLFQGGLMAMRILLPKEIQEFADAGLADASRIPSMLARAMRLHELIEDIRKKLRPTAGPNKKGTLLNPPRPVASSSNTPEPLPMPGPDKPKKAEPPIVPVLNNPPKGTPAPVTTAPPSDEPPLLPFVPKIPTPDKR